MFYVVLDGKRLLPPREIAFVGRDAGCDVNLLGEEVSRRHACILDLGDRVMVLDLKSSNGTFVNSARVDHEVVRAGDRIGIGQAVLTIEPLDGPLPREASGHPSAALCKRFLNTEHHTAALRKSYAHLAEAPDRQTLELLRRYVSELGTLNAAADLCRLALQVAMRTSGSDGGFVMLAGQSREGLEVMAREGVADLRFLRRNLHYVLVSEALENLRVVMTQPRFFQQVVAPHTNVLVDVAAAVAVPLVYLGTAIGLIYLERRFASGRYGDDDLHVPVFVAYQASMVLGNLRVLSAAWHKPDMLLVLEQTLHGGDFAACEVCGQALDKDERQLVSCAACETLHHADCWEYNRRCSVYGCKSTRSKPAPGS
ncbi:MAG: FHA domain-containing protein [Candidatus Riflebacteria bacterium]|nr:FHA domain-containing protein [Candidatus Riflebacteria bacterium]